MHPAKHKFRRLALLALLVLALIQFIRPEPNKGESEGPDSIVAKYKVPDEVRAILQRSCYDCHSDRTNYPWYAQVQPARWWLESHIQEGREHLNFSAFGRYDARTATHALDEVVNTLIAGSMPLKSYTFLHRDAVLTKAEADRVMDWAEGLIDEISDD